MNDSKTLFVNLKLQNTLVPPCSPLNTTKNIINNMCTSPVNLGKHAVYSNNNRAQRGNTGTFSDDFLADQSRVIHDYFYGWMAEFLPAWRSKWDMAVQNSDWKKVKILMLAIFQKLPQCEQDILRPAISHLAPWFEEPKTYWPTCWILDRDGNKHGRIAVEVKAASREAAAAQLLGQGFEVKTW